MRWFHGLIFACGLVAAAAGSSKAQGVLAGDVAGFGPLGLSNGKGYAVRRPPPNRFGPHMGRLAERMNKLGMQGYWTPLYYASFSSTGPTAYYDAQWSGINGAPSPEVASRGYGYSPPWSAAYRQGEPRKHKLFSHLHHKD